jgi:hypothetical protein
MFEMLFPANIMSCYAVILPFVAFDILNDNKNFEALAQWKDSDQDKIALSD